MTVLESTLEKLKVLPEDKLEAVSHYINTLNSRPKGRFDDLSGCMKSEEVDKMESAINDAFERIYEY
jgi:hypothetical protein